MSATNTSAAQPAQPTTPAAAPTAPAGDVLGITEEQFKTAAAVLSANAYQPAFFARLEQRYGLRPANDEEARDYLKLAAYKQAERAQRDYNAAAAGNSLLKRAVAQYESGQDGAQSSRDLAQMSLGAAAELAKDANLQQSLAIYAAGLAG